MNAIRKIFRYPISRLILRGSLKALIIAPMSSLLFAAYIVNQIYGPTFDGKLHFFGTASEFFVFAFIFTLISSIPVSLLTIVLLSIFLRANGARKQISYEKSFFAGFLIGGIIGYLGALIIAGQAGDIFLIVIVVILAGVAGGLGGLWMTKDALRLFSINLE